MFRNLKFVLVFLLASFLIVGAYEKGHNDAIEAARKRADAQPMKKIQQRPGKPVRASHPALPSHLYCPPINARGRALVRTTAHQADGGEWQIECSYAVMP